MSYNPAAFSNSARFSGGLTCGALGCTATFSTGALGFTPRYARISYVASSSQNLNDSEGAFVGTGAPDQTVASRGTTYDSAGLSAVSYLSTTGLIARIFDTGGVTVSVTATAFGAGGITISATASGANMIDATQGRFLLEVFG